MEIGLKTLKYHSTEILFDISKVNDWKSLISLIKTSLKLEQDKDIDIYVLPENNYLKESNFEEEFLARKQTIKGISVFDVIDLGDKLKNLVINNDNNNIPLNHIEEIDNEESTVSMFLDPSKLIFKEKCQLCGANLNSSKFLCLYCKNYSLCEKCEEKHPHPLIKFKSPPFSESVESVLSVHALKAERPKAVLPLIQEHFKVKKFFSVKLRTNVPSNSFSMGPNQERKLSLIIKNDNKFNIPKNQLNVVIRDQYDLNIILDDDCLKKDFAPKTEIPIILTVKSNEKNLMKKYKLVVEIISSNLSIIDSRIILEIDIVNDDEDNELNKNFNQFPSIMLLPKDRKKQIKYIIDEKLSLKTPQQVRAIMDKFKWNIDEAIVDLTC